MRLTVKNVEAMRPGAERREIPDAHMPGLYLVMQPSGARSWAVRYRHHGQSRKHTLGSYPAVDLKAARALAGKALRAVAEGRDPGREKIEARAAKVDSIDHIIAEFLERHVRHSNRPRTAQETERLFRLHVLPRWHGRMIHSLNRRDVIDVIDRVVDAGAPIAANRTLTVVKTLFNWCIARDIITVSPAQGVKPPTVERARDRVLDDSELELVWQVAGKVGYPFGPLVQVLILTGQRRDEVAKMRWAEVDLEKRLWALPRERVKNDRPHEVPLSAAAISVLKAAPRLIGSPFVFTINGTSPSSGYGKNKKRLDALLPASMPHWTLHDLRRSVASGLARLGVNLPVIEKVLNHSSGSFAGIVAVYQRHDFADEKRQALEAWGRHVEGLTSGKPASKVVRLRGKRS
jgi:integrase